MKWLWIPSLGSQCSNRRDQCIEGRAMCRRIHHCLDRTSPVDTELSLFIPIIIPDAGRTAAYHLPVDILRGCFLQHPQVANKDSLELCAIWKALRLTEFMDNIVRVGQCRNGCLCNLVGCG